MFSTQIKLYRVFYHFTLNNFENKKICEKKFLWQKLPGKIITK
jgi:hypothetical protein